METEVAKKKDVQEFEALLEESSKKLSQGIHDYKSKNIFFFFFFFLKNLFYVKYQEANLKELYLLKSSK